jgi:hypothetical protein
LIYYKFREAFEVENSINCSNNAFRNIFTELINFREESKYDLTEEEKYKEVLIFATMTTGYGCHLWSGNNINYIFPWLPCPPNQGETWKYGVIVTKGIEKLNIRIYILTDGTDSLQARLSLHHYRI